MLVVAVGIAGFKRVWGKTRDFELQADQGAARSWAPPKKQSRNHKAGTASILKAEKLRMASDRPIISLFFQLNNAFLYVLSTVGHVSHDHANGWGSEK
jgi:hypothetical protein